MTGGISAWSAGITLNITLNRSTDNSHVSRRLRDRDGRSLLDNGQCDAGATRHAKGAAVGRNCDAALSLRDSYCCRRLHDGDSHIRLLEDGQQNRANGRGETQDRGQEGAARRRHGLLPGSTSLCSVRLVDGVYPAAQYWRDLDDDAVERVRFRLVWLLAFDPVALRLVNRMNPRAQDRHYRRE